MAAEDVPRPLDVQFRSSFSHGLLCDRLFYLCHVRAFSGPLIKGEVLVNSNQPEALTSWSLEIKGRVRYLQFPDETGFEDLSPHFLHVVGLDFQPNRSGTSQELALIGDIPIEKPDEEVFSQANEVPFR